MNEDVIFAKEHETLSLGDLYYNSLKEKESLFIFEWMESEKKVKLGYYIGLEWIRQNEIALYVSPKLVDSIKQTNYLKMLDSCLRHPEVRNQTNNLYNINFTEPYIAIEQSQDLLTPLLILKYLQVVKDIVRKGLKKSYYRIEHNLNARIKGKVLIADSLKHNVVKQKTLYTICQYEEYGNNGIENRLLKKALRIVQRYLSMLNISDFNSYVSELVSYVVPAFHAVDDHIELSEVKFTKTNIFFKEYEEGLRLAKIIIKHCSFLIDNHERGRGYEMPPFWIDMSKLFELYVLGLLKDRFGNAVEYHRSSYYNETDYILNDGNDKIIVDAKYKPQYQQLNCFEISDIRQLSGYARDISILKKLEIIDKSQQKEKVVDCVIIYPDQSQSDSLPNDLKNVPMSQFVNFYKCGIKLPTMTRG
jgi:5-methylcytosine-specific restriction enzyme subunit McrC